jgi:hypothetical protein
MFMKLINRKLLNLNKNIVFVLDVRVSFKFTKEVTHFNTWKLIKCIIINCTWHVQKIQQSQK